MRFTISAAVLAFASAAFAQTSGFDAMTTPTKDEQVPAGKTYTINWQPGTYTSGTVTVSLLGGATPETLQVLGSLASGIENSAGSYTWSVDSALGDLATYGIKISLDSDPTIFQYSFPFHITGSSSETSSSSSASASGYPTAGTTSSSSSSSAVETYSASVTVTTTSSSAVVTESSSSFPSLTPSGTAGVSGAATGSGIPSTLTSTVKSSATSSSTSTSTPIVTNGAPRAAAGVTAVLLGAVAAIFAL